MFGSLGKFLKKFRTVTQIDADCSVERLGRDEYKYIEGNRALVLQIEMLSGTPTRLIYSRTIKNWLPPNENEIIDEEKRKEIVEKIGKYFELNGTAYTVQ